MPTIKTVEFTQKQLEASQSSGIGFYSVLGWLVVVVVGVVIVRAAFSAWKNASTEEPIEEEEEIPFVPDASIDKREVLQCQTKALELLAAATRGATASEIERNPAVPFLTKFLTWCGLQMGQFNAVDSEIYKVWSREWKDIEEKVYQRVHGEMLRQFDAFERGEI